MLKSNPLILLFHRPPSPHTLENKETKNSTLECKENTQKLNNSNVKNVNKKKNPLTPAKLDSKKQDKKIMDSQEGSGRKLPSCTLDVLYSF